MRKKRSRSLEVEVEIDAPADAVYEALTDAKELTRWFPPHAGDNEDGTVWVSWDGETKFSAPVDVAEPGKRIRFVYLQPPPGRDPSTFEEKDFVEIATDYTLATRGGKTVLRLVHSGFGAEQDWDDLFDGTRSGWQFELRGLKHYLEHHRGRDRLIAWAKAPYRSSRDDAWNRIIGREGLRAEGVIEGAVEGTRYAIRAATGDRLEGTVHYCEPPRSFVATVDNLERSFLRVKLEELYGLREANVWLSAYALPREDVQAFEQRWQALLEDLFASGR